MKIKLDDDWGDYEEIEENHQMTDLRTSQMVWAELNRRLPVLAEKLGTNVDSIELFNYHSTPTTYMMTEYRDVCIGKLGPIEDIPFIHTGRTNEESTDCGWGVCFFKSSQKEDLKYAVYTQRVSHGSHKYLIISKENAVDYFLLANKAEKKSSYKCDAPILEEGILNRLKNDTIGFLNKSKLLEKFGVKVKKGIILQGDPGNGKTMACRYIQKLCSQNGYSWGTITSSELDSSYQENCLNDLFSQYTVSFFDDIDIQYLDRSKGNGKMACSLLTAMDGMSELGHVVRIFTTNEDVKSLDKAFVRPGRIDSFISFKKPTPDLIRKLVVDKWPEDIKKNIDIEKLIKACKGFSFAEVESIRTLLVSEKIINNGVWDLDKALSEFNSRSEEHQSIASQKSVGGFAAGM